MTISFRSIARVAPLTFVAPVVTTEDLFAAFLAGNLSFADYLALA